MLSCLVKYRRRKAHYWLVGLLKTSVFHVEIEGGNVNFLRLQRHGFLEIATVLVLQLFARHNHSALIHPQNFPPVLVQTGNLVVVSFLAAEERHAVLDAIYSG